PSLLVGNARQFNDASTDLPGGKPGSVFGRCRIATMRHGSRQQLVAFAHYRSARPAGNIARSTSFVGFMGGCMQANKVSCVIWPVSPTAMVAFTSGPSEGQTAPEVRPAARAAVVVRAPARVPARVTVHKRSFLDPGTETKRHAEHYSDYASPPVEYGFAP